MVVRVIIVNFEVQKVLVDQGSSTDILLVDVFNKLSLMEEQISPFYSALVGS